VRSKHAHLGDHEHDFRIPEFMHQKPVSCNRTEYMSSMRVRRHEKDHRSILLETTCCSVPWAHTVPAKGGLSAGPGGPFMKKATGRYAYAVNAARIMAHQKKMNSQRKGCIPKSNQIYNPKAKWCPYAPTPDKCNKAPLCRWNGYPPRKPTPKIGVAPPPKGGRCTVKPASKGNRWAGLCGFQKDRSKCTGICHWVGTNTPPAGGGRCTVKPSFKTNRWAGLCGFQKNQTKCSGICHWVR
jgi:hypothetical protein